MVHRTLSGRLGRFARHAAAFGAIAVERDPREPGHRRTRVRQNVDRTGRRDREHRGREHPVRPPPSPDLAGCRTPFGAVGLFLEVRAGDKRLEEILGVFDDRLDQKPLFSIRLVEQVIVFGDCGLIAIGDAVAAQIADRPGRRQPSATPRPSILACLASYPRAKRHQSAECASGCLRQFRFLGFCRPAR